MSTATCFGFDSYHHIAQEAATSPPFTFLTDEPSQLFSSYGERQRVFSHHLKLEEATHHHYHERCSSDSFNKEPYGWCGSNVQTLPSSFNQQAPSQPKQRYAIDCQFCESLGEEKQQARMIPHWQSRLTDKLYHKYASSQNYYYTRDINDLLTGVRSPASIRLKETLTTDEDGEYFKRSYAECEYDRKSKLLTEYYKFHNDLPRLFMLPLTNILNNFQEKKRRLEYFRIAQIIEAENKENPQRPPKGIIGERPERGTEQSSDNCDSSSDRPNYRGGQDEQLTEELLLDNISSFVNRGISAQEPVVGSIAASFESQFNTSSVVCSWDWLSQGAEAVTTVVPTPAETLNHLKRFSQFDIGTHLLDIPISSRFAQRETYASIQQQSSQENSSSMNQIVANRQRLHHQSISTIPETAQINYKRRLEQYGVSESHRRSKKSFQLQQQQQQQQKQQQQQQQQPQHQQQLSTKSSIRLGEREQAEENTTIRELNQKLEEIVNVSANSSCCSHSRLSLHGNVDDQQHLEEFLEFLKITNNEVLLPSSPTMKKSSTAAAHSKLVTQKPRTMNTIHIHQEPAFTSPDAQVQLASTPRSIYGIPAATIISMISNTTAIVGTTPAEVSQKRMLTSQERLKVVGQFAKPKKSQVQDFIVNQVKQQSSSGGQFSTVLTSNDIQRAREQSREDILAAVSQQTTNIPKSKHETTKDCPPITILTPRNPLVNSLALAMSLQAAGKLKHPTPYSPMKKNIKPFQHSNVIQHQQHQLQYSPRDSYDLVSKGSNYITQHNAQQFLNQQQQQLQKTIHRPQTTTQLALMSQNYINSQQTSQPSITTMPTLESYSYKTEGQQQLQQVTKKKQQLKQSVVKSQHVQSTPYMNQLTLQLKLDQLTSSRDKGLSYMNQGGTSLTQSAVFSHITRDPLSQRSGTGKNADKQYGSNGSKYTFYDMFKQAISTSSQSPPQISTSHTNYNSNINACTSVLNTKNNHTTAAGGAGGAVSQFPIPPFSLEIITPPVAVTEQHSVGRQSQRTSSYLSKNSSLISSQQAASQTLSTSPGVKTKQRGKGHGGDSINTSPGGYVAKPLIAARKSHPMLLSRDSLKKETHAVASKGVSKPSSKQHSNHHPFAKSVILDKERGKNFLYNTRASSPSQLDVDVPLDAIKREKGKLSSISQPYLQGQLVQMQMKPNEKQLKMLAVDAPLSQVSVGKTGSAHKHTRSENLANAEFFCSYDQPLLREVTAVKTSNSLTDKPKPSSIQSLHASGYTDQRTQSSIPNVSLLQIPHQYSVAHSSKQQSHQPNQIQLTSPMLSQRSSKGMFHQLDQFRLANSSCQNANKCSNSIISSNNATALGSFIIPSAQNQQTQSQTLQHQSYPFLQTQWQPSRDFLISSVHINNQKSAEQKQSQTVSSSRNKFTSSKTSPSTSIVQSLATSISMASQLQVQPPHALAVKQANEPRSRRSPLACNLISTKKNNKKFMQ